MGLYSRYVRPGKIGEVSIIGFVLLMLALDLGVGERAVEDGEKAVSLGIDSLPTVSLHKTLSHIQTQAGSEAVGEQGNGEVPARQPLTHDAAADHDDEQ